MKEVTWERGNGRLGMVHLTRDGEKTLCGAIAYGGKLSEVYGGPVYDPPAELHRCRRCQSLKGNWVDNSVDH